MKLDNLIIKLLGVSEAPALLEPGVVAGSDAGSRFQLSIWMDDVDAVCVDLEERV